MEPYIIFNHNGCCNTFSLNTRLTFYRYFLTVFGPLLGSLSHLLYEPVLYTRPPIPFACGLQDKEEKTNTIKSGSVPSQYRKHVSWALASVHISIMYTYC